jgi:hypothetical protein
MNARYFLTLGAILIVLGAVLLAVPSYTYFTMERVAETRFINIDISRPHTIVFNPVAGGMVLGAGMIVFLMGIRYRPA